MKRPESAEAEPEAGDVAVASTWFAAERTPAKINGSALGISTLRRTCIRDSPIPRAASRTSGSTVSMPAAAARTIDGTARIVSATSTG